jgi:hypothetical protein
MWKCDECGNGKLLILGLRDFEISLHPKSDIITSDIKITQFQNLKISKLK